MGGGDMLCASLRATMILAVAGCTVWSVNHLYGPLPTTYTWGYYRSDVSCVFGTWLDKAHIARLRAGTRRVGSASACRLVRAHTDFRLGTAAAWLMLRNCFHAQHNDPPNTDAGLGTWDWHLGLINAVLW